jgi:pimeloyl-ACP methyl ester carboxylesterase
VLCHGFIGSSEYLIPLIEALLPTQRRIFALDLYGRGHSDCVDVENNYVLFTEQISELLETLSITSPIDLVGYSMGGGIVVQFGAHNLSLLRSLTLIAPVGLPSMTIGPSNTLKLVLKALKYCSYTLYGGYLHEWLTAEVLKPNDKVLCQGWTKVDTPRFLWYKQHMLCRFENEEETLPRAVSSTLLNLPFNSLSKSYAAIGETARSHTSRAPPPLPVLAMWGVDDQSVPCDGDGLKRLIPQAKVITWPNEGHMLPVELAEEVGAKMMEFWTGADID